MPRFFLTLIAFSILIECPPHPAAVLAQDQPDASVPLKLPLKPKSIRFAAIGDNGTGTKEQYDVAAQMARFHERFPFEFVVMLGDNIYGGQTAADFKAKFEN